MMVQEHDIEALVDRHLSAEDEKRVRALIERDPAAHLYFIKLQRQKIMLSEWFRGTHQGH